MSLNFKTVVREQRFSVPKVPFCKTKDILCQHFCFPSGSDPRCSVGFFLDYSLIGVDGFHKPEGCRNLLEVKMPERDLDDVLVPNLTEADVAAMRSKIEGLSDEQIDLLIDRMEMVIENYKQMNAIKENAKFFLEIVSILT